LPLCPPTCLFLLNILPFLFRGHQDSQSSLVASMMCVFATLYKTFRGLGYVMGMVFEWLCIKPQQWESVLKSLLNEDIGVSEARGHSVTSSVALNCFMNL
jgi:hypothetical protein